MLGARQAVRARKRGASLLANCAQTYLSFSGDRAPGKAIGGDGGDGSPGGG